MADVEKLLSNLNSKPSGKSNIQSVLSSINRARAHHSKEQAYSPVDGMSTTDKVLAGIGHGMVGTWEGANQLARETGNKLGLVSEKSVKDYNQKVANEQKLWQPLGNTAAGKVGNIAGETAAMLPFGAVGEGADIAIPAIRASGLGGFAANALRTGLKGAAEGAAVGASQPITGQNQSRAANAAFGAGLGAAAPAAIWGAGKAAQVPMDIVRPFFGGARKRMVGEHLLKQATNPDAHISEPPLPGMQMNIGAATNDPGLLSLSRAVQMKNRGRALGERMQNETAMNKAVDSLGVIENSQPQASRNLAKSLDKSLKINKGLAKTQYGNIGEHISSHGGIEPTNLKQATDQLLQEYPDLFDRLPDAGLQSKLKTLSQGATPQNESTGIVDHAGNPITKTTTPKLSYPEFNWLDQRLGDYQRRAYASAGATGSKETHAIGNARNALRNDFHDWVEKTGNEDLKKARDEASQFYQQNVVPFKSGPLKRATSTDIAGRPQTAPEDVAASLIHPGKNSEQDLRQYMQATKSNMGARKDGAHYLLQDIFERSRGIDGHILPNRLEDIVKRYEPHIKALLNGDQRMMLKNIVKAAKKTGATESRAAMLGGNSNTAAEIASGNIARHTFLDHFFGRLMGHGLGSVISAPLDMIYKAPDEQLNQLLVDAVHNPKLAKELMMKASKPNLHFARKVGQRLIPYASPAAARAGVSSANP